MYIGQTRALLCLTIVYLCYCGSFVYVSILYIIYIPLIFTVLYNIKG